MAREKILLYILILNTKNVCQSIVCIHFICIQTKFLCIYINQSVYFCSINISLFEYYII